MSGETRRLADWLRDWRMAECEHASSRGLPVCCSPCLRDRILASDWLAEHDAEVEARVREQIAQAIEARLVHIHPNAYKGGCVDGCGWLNFAASVARGGGVR